MFRTTGMQNRKICFCEHASEHPLSTLDIVLPELSNNTSNIALDVQRVFDIVLDIVLPELLKCISKTV